MSFATKGYAICPVLPPEEVVALREDVTDQIDRVARALHLPFEKSEPDAPFAERLERIARKERTYADLLRLAVATDAHRGPRILPMMEDRRIRDRAEALAGCTLGKPVMRLRINVPTLAARRHPWHSDRIFESDDESCKVRITCWIPLMDAGPGNGGLELIPGKRDAAIPHIREGRFLIPDDAVAGLPTVQADCPIGSALFLDRYTPHRALPNDSDGARIALVIWLKAV